MEEQGGQKVGQGQEGKMGRQLLTYVLIRAGRGHQQPPMEKCKPLKGRQPK